MNEDKLRRILLAYQQKLADAQLEAAVLKVDLEDSRAETDTLRRENEQLKEAPAGPMPVVTDA